MGNDVSAELPHQAEGAVEGRPAEPQPAPGSGQQVAGAPGEGERKVGDPAGAQLPDVARAGLPDGMSLSEYVKAEVDKVRKEYEGKDGHLSQLRATYERKLAETKAHQTTEAQRALQQAQALVEKNPRQAAQLMAEQLSAYVARDSQSVAEEQMSHWAAGVAEQFGLTINDPEVTELLEEVGPLTDPRSSYELLGRMAQLQIDRQKKDRDAAVQSLSEFTKALPSLVRQQVLTVLTEGGMADVDPSRPGRPATANKNPIAEIQDPSVLLAMAAKSAKEKRAKNQ